MAKIMAMAIATAAKDPDLRVLACRGLLIGVAFALACALLILNLGDLAARTRHPLLAQQTSFASPAAATVAAASELENGNADRAGQLARESLSHAPLSAEALRIFALAAEAKGDLDLTGKAMTLAGALGWRDTPTQTWLIEAYVAQGDYTSALLRVDALLRRGQLEEQMYPLLVGFALEPEARPELVQRLSQNPEWRRIFFETAHHLPSNRFDEYEGFLRFAAPRVSLASSEAEPFVSRLFDDKQYSRSARIWRDFGLGAQDRKSIVHDGEFARTRIDADHSGPFEWRLPQPAGSDTLIAAPPGREDDLALNLSASGAGRLLGAAQRLALPPGSYILSYESLGEDERTGGFVWEVNCSGIGSALLGQRTVTTSDGWSRNDVAFRIASGCPVQEMRLHIRPTGTARADLWVDKISIRPSGS